VANPAEFYPSDLTNVVAPGRPTWIGDSFFQALRALWRGNDAENTAYLPLTMLVLLVAVVLVRRTRVTAALAVFAGIAFVLSLGPWLTVAGVPTVPMPWAVAGKIPGLDHALPSRFSAFVFMALAVLVAQAWTAPALRRWFAPAAALASCVLLLPNLPAMPFPVDASIAGYVTSGRLEEAIDPGENVLVLPVGQWGPGMRWMDELDFGFTMPSGNGGGAELPPQLQEPLGVALYTRDLAYDYRSELPPFLAEVGVDTVIVDDGHPEWKAVMDRVLSVRAETEDGAWVYRLP
jgi:hypothetical protein